MTACSEDAESSVDQAEHPLEEYLGAGTVYFSMTGGTSVLLGYGERIREQRDEGRRFQHAVEDAIAACMADEGFEYVPHVREPAFEGFPDAEDEKFVRTYGYAKTVSAFSGPDQPSNPNDEIRNALSDRARAEYDLSLEGDGQEPGCYRESADKASDDLSISAGDPDLTEFASLEADLRTLGERIQADKRLEQPQQAWSDCMAQAGHPGLEELWDPRELVSERIRQVPGYAEWLAEQDYSYVRGTFDIDPATYEDLLDYEITVATADYECLDEHYADVFNAVRRDLEAEFVENHRHDLEVYRDRFAHTQ